MTSRVEALTSLLQIIAGKPKGNSLSMQSLQSIQSLRKDLPPLMKSEPVVRELIVSLCEAEYLQRRTVKTTREFCSSFEVYVLTEKGRAALNTSVVLPVSPAIRHQEAEQERRRSAMAKEVASFGLDASSLPPHLEDSPVLWYVRKLQHWKASGDLGKVEKHEALRQQILRWREEAAQRLRLAPAAVLSEYTCVALTYVQPTTVEAIKSVGVRITGVEELASLISKAKEDMKGAEGAEGTEGAEGAEGKGSTSQVEGIPTPSRRVMQRRVQMQLPAGQVVPPRKWPAAVYKPGKKGAKPVWELSYDRFLQGESVHSIAMSVSGAAIQPSTVRSHVLTAWAFGKPVDLRRLESESLPSQAEWSQLEEAAAASGADFDAEVKLKDVLAQLLGDNVHANPGLKSEADKEVERQWYERMRFWEACRKVQFQPTFEGGDAKRQRLD